MPDDTRNTPKNITWDAATVSQSTTPPTVADAIRCVAQWHDLPNTQRRDTASALAVIAKIVGQSAETIPLTVDLIQGEVLDRSAAALRMSVGHRRNVIGRIRSVLRRLDMIDPEPDTLLPAWDTLLKPFGSRGRAPFVRFAKFCTLRDIPPEDVTDKVYAEFGTWIRTRALVAQPTRIVASFRQGWNKQVAKGDGWPTTKLTMPPRKSAYILPEAAFSASFIDALDRFVARVTATNVDDMFGVPSDPFGASGDMPSHPAKPLTMGSANLRRAHLRWAASALVASGMPVDDIQDLASLVQPITRAGSILRFLFEHANRKPNAASTHVGEVLSMVAKYHAPVPKAEQDYLEGWRKHGALTYTGMTARNTIMVERVLVPETYAKLMRLPVVLMDEAAARLADDPRSAVSLALRAVAIQALLSVPMLRLSNLIGLRLDRHLQRADLRSGRVSRIMIAAHETKNNNEISVEIGDNLARFIDLWTTKFRPLIALPNNPYLFPGPDQKKIGSQGMRAAIKTATHAFIGVSINPHLFRHINAVAFLQQHPGQHRVVQQFLNHKDFATTLRSYTGPEKTAALEMLDAMIEAGQKTVTKPKRAKRNPSHRPTYHRSSQPPKPHGGRRGGR